MSKHIQGVLPDWCNTHAQTAWNCLRAAEKRAEDAEAENEQFAAKMAGLIQAAEDAEEKALTWEARAKTAATAFESALTMEPLENGRYPHLLYCNGIGQHPETPGVICNCRLYVHLRDAVRERDAARAIALGGKLCISEQHKQLAEALAASQALALRWKKAVEGLTPSGSEFVDDPEACAAFIRKRCEWPRQIREAQALAQRLRKGATEAKERLEGMFQRGGAAIPLIAISGIIDTLADALAEAHQAAPQGGPCLHPIGGTTCGYPEHAPMHIGSLQPEPPAGRHQYAPAAPASQPADPKMGQQIDVKDIPRVTPASPPGETMTAPPDDGLPPKPWIPAHVFKWGAPVRPHDFIHDGIGDKHSGRCQAYVQAGPMTAICSRPFDAHRCVDHGCGEPFSRHPVSHSERSDSPDPQEKP